MSYGNSPNKSVNDSNNGPDIPAAPPVEAPINNGPDVVTAPTPYSKLRKIRLNQNAAKDNLMINFFVGARLKGTNNFKVSLDNVTYSENITGSYFNALNVGQITYKHNPHEVFQFYVKQTASDTNYISGFPQSNGINDVNGSNVQITSEDVSISTLATVFSAQDINTDAQFEGVSAFRFKVNRDTLVNNISGNNVYDGDTFTPVLCSSSIYLLLGAGNGTK